MALALTLALSNMALALVAVLGLGIGFKDNICGLGLVGEKQNFNIVCRLYEFNSHCARLQNNTTLSETKHQLIKKYKIYQ